MILSLLTEHFYAGELVFFLLTCGGAWMTGRAVARVWQGPVTFLVYSLGLAAGARFLHYALYGGPFVSLPHYLSDLIVLAIVGILAHRFTRTGQMVSQYPLALRQGFAVELEGKRLTPPEASSIHQLRQFQGEQA